MPDTPQQIGQYHIEREIGRGGMGVVYLAIDPRLDRSVAIKAMPAEVSQDAERLARFEREARTLAQLDHPNLAGIHGVEVDGDQRYLVLEYIEGESLNEILERGPLPIDESLELCAQIAAGVASAHDGGVIHRDLKPANIKITPEGKAKVLDFGLAKSSEPTSSTSHSEMPTLTTPRADFQSQTIPGAILGTAPYMSPEQARGRRVDRRSDVWSFGCILYECLTGARLFAGETATDSMGAILHKEIDFGLLPRETPVRVRELLMRTLERDKDRRLRDLGDAMLELEMAQSEIGLATNESGGADKSRPTWFAAMLLVVLAVVITSGAMWSMRPGGVFIEAAPNPHPRFQMTKLTDDTGIEGWPSLSSDGLSMVYFSQRGGDTNIHTRRVDGLNATNLTAEYSSNDYSPTLSPDGQTIAFNSDRDGGGIFVMGATGETPRRLTDSGFNPAWSPDGERLVYATELVLGPFGRTTISSLWTVDVKTGESQQLFVGDAVQPNWSPSGQRIAYWNVVSSGQRDLFTVAIDGTDPVAVTNDPPTDWNPVWSPDGEWLYFSSDRGGGLSIWRIAIDESTGITSGAPQQITTSFSGGVNGLSFSADGSKLVFVSGTYQTGIMRLDLNAKTGAAIDEPRSITPFNSQIAMSSISPDGESIAYTNTGERQEDLFILSSNGERRQRVTNDAAKDRGPIWSEDGSRLIFYSDRDGLYRIWSIRTDGGGLELLLESDEPLMTPLVSPDAMKMSILNKGSMKLCQNDSEDAWTIDQFPIPPEGIESPVPVDWSANSNEMLVLCRNMETKNPVLAIYNVESEIYELIEAPSAFSMARFTAADRSIAISTDAGLIRYNRDNGKTTTMYSTPPGAEKIGRFDIASDDSWVAFNTRHDEADIWMIEFEQAESAER